jgi:hypothetical protein
VVVLGHPHRHLGRALPAERECALGRVELDEVAVEVGIKLVAGGKDRGVGGVTGGEGHRELLGLARVRVDHQQGVSAAVVEQPHEHDVAAGAVNGGDGAAGLTER